MSKIMYSAEEVNQILFEITLDKAKVEEKLSKIEQIIDSRDGFYLYDNLPPFQQIREVLEDE